MKISPVSFLVSILTGMLFGAGLAYSGMVNPTKAQNFFDFFGNWDPSLALTFAVALSITWLAYQIQKKMTGPVVEGEKFAIPNRTDIDARLLIGAGIFGVGWGLFGYCPGPDVASMMFGNPSSFIYFAGLVLGVLLTWLVPAKK